MRLVGGIGFVVFAAAAGYALLQIYRRGRPADVIFALAAPMCAVLAVLGLVLVFVPDFL